MENLKRKLSTEDTTDMKKLRVHQPNILDFSDCVLTCILSYLDSYDLFQLSRTCTRFKYLIKLRKLWKRIDVRDRPMCLKKFRFFFDNINATTDLLMVRGISSKEKTLTTLQFYHITDIVDNLTILAIEKQFINSDEVTTS